MKQSRIAVATNASLQAQLQEFDPEDLLSVEEVASRLRNEVSWVREKVRRRCPYPMPVYNLGRHLLFDWKAVSEWIRNAPRPVHAAHRRLRKAQKAAA